MIQTFNVINTANKSELNDISNGLNNILNLKDDYSILKTNKELSTTIDSKLKMFLNMLRNNGFTKLKTDLFNNNPYSTSVALFIDKMSVDNLTTALSNINKQPKVVYEDYNKEHLTLFLNNALISLLTEAMNNKSNQMDNNGKEENDMEVNDEDLDEQLQQSNLTVGTFKEDIIETIDSEVPLEIKEIGKKAVADYMKFYKLYKDTIPANELKQLIIERAGSYTV